MPNKKRKHIRCPYFNKNIWIDLEFEKNIDGEEIIVCMSCKKKDSLERQNLSCKVECKNYFFPE